jgi:DNA (cytosine-5)-methyltransferase 1
MTHASLFSGIGGFDLAAEWIGWENIFHCEWNPFGQKVLAHHFPNSKSYNDITKTDFSLHAGQVDVLTGGFPCQPYSSAGKRLGKADERHLFPHMLRCIKEVKPKWVVGENVRGLVNWNGGMVFNEVYDDLEREGYEVQSFLIPASSVGARHQRQRIWFIAYSKCSRLEYRSENGNLSKEKTKTFIKRSCTSKKFETNCSRFDKCWTINEKTESIVCRGNDGISRELDGITFSKWRNESIKAYGNAIVPQVAHQIFKTIQRFEDIVNV